MNNLFVIILLSCIILFNIFVRIDTIYITVEGNQTLTSQYSADSNDAGFGGTGAYSTADLSRLDYKFAPTDASFNEITDYSKSINDYNVEYHDSAEQIAKETGYGLDVGTVWVFDPITNKKVALQSAPVQNLPTYYIPGIYKYGARPFIPTYTDGVVLSSTNRYL